MINESMKENNTFLQKIWKIHTDVQEQMLQLRSIPVTVDPKSAKIVGDKLFRGQYINTYLSDSKYI